jgi:hypothetical protein
MNLVPLLCKGDVLCECPVQVPFTLVIFFSQHANGGGPVPIYSGTSRLDRGEYFRVYEMLAPIFGLGELCGAWPEGGIFQHIEMVFVAASGRIFT